MARMASTLYRQDTRKGKFRDSRMFQVERNNEGRNTLEGMDSCAFRAAVWLVGVKTIYYERDIWADHLSLVECCVYPKVVCACTLLISRIVYHPKGLGGFYRM